MSFVYQNIIIQSLRTTDVQEPRPARVMTFALTTSPSLQGLKLQDYRTHYIANLNQTNYAIPNVQVGGKVGTRFANLYTQVAFSHARELSVGTVASKHFTSGSSIHYILAVVLVLLSIELDSSISHEDDMNKGVSERSRRSMKLNPRHC